MDIVSEGRIYYPENAGWKIGKKLYGFSSLEDSIAMNNAMNTLQTEGSWPGYSITLVNLANTTETLIMLDSELAQIDWRGPRTISFEQNFLRMALVCALVIPVLFLILRYVK